MSSLVLIFLAAQCSAISIDDYHKRVREAVNALDSLTQLLDEGENDEDFDLRFQKTLTGLKSVLPITETIEWNDQTINIDNQWFHYELEQCQEATVETRNERLSQAIQKLRAIEERLSELNQGGVAASLEKSDAKNKLQEILNRPEYERKGETNSALTRLLIQLLEWIRSLFPEPRPLSPSQDSLFTRLLQIFVVVLALAVVVYTLKMFAAHSLRNRRSKKHKSKHNARIVLGERLEDDQSARDLLAEAEALARRGELRAAIRKGYIALLLELGERKLLHLEQHKTNRDYLNSLDQQRVYETVRQLTELFETHWYGFRPPTEADWQTFRIAYERALRI